MSSNYVVEPGRMRKDNYEDLTALSTAARLYSATIVLLNRLIATGSHPLHLGVDAFYLLPSLSLSCGSDGAESEKKRTGAKSSLSGTYLARCCLLRG